MLFRHFANFANLLGKMFKNVLRALIRDIKSCFKKGVLSESRVFIVPNTIKTQFRSSELVLNGTKAWRDCVIGNLLHF